MTPFFRNESLHALQGRMVITDEYSPFKWVGSIGAGPCIIAVVYGTDDTGKKIAACAHISVAESPWSINYMLNRAGITKIIDARLVSGKTDKDDQFAKECLEVFSYRGITPIVSLGKGLKNVALDVRTGEVSHDAHFTMANAGEKNRQCLEVYHNKAVINIMLGIRPLVELSIDGRKEEDVIRVEKLLQSSEPPVLLIEAQIGLPRLAVLMIDKESEVLQSSMHVEQEGILIVAALVATIALIALAYLYQRYIHQSGSPERINEPLKRARAVVMCDASTRGTSSETATPALIKNFH